MANQPKEQQTQFLKYAKLANNTGKSISDISAFIKELDRIQACGYGFDDEEYAIGVGCLAVPIRDADGEAIAAIGTTGRYIMYDTPEKIANLVSVIQEAAQNVTRLLKGIPLSNL